MPDSPPFLLRNVFDVLGSVHAWTAKPTSHDFRGSSGAVPTKSPSGSDTRIAHWSTASGHPGGAADFAGRLDGGQVSTELLNIFRETPEFRRSLANRLESFLNESEEGALRLIAVGGEAVVFHDRDASHAIKLLTPPGKARFGWVLERQANGRWGIRGGSLAEAVVRFAWMEAFFGSGLELDQVGGGSRINQGVNFLTNRSNDGMSRAF